MKKILEVKKEIGTLSKNSKNPFFKSAYLDLSDLLNAVEPLLHKNGLVLLQPIIGNSVKSVIYDAESGDEICRSAMDIPSNITDPQKLGSCISYFRRYTLKSLLAISETDDDGNLAAKPKPKQKLDDEKLKGCEKWTKEQKDAVIKKYSLTPEQLKQLK